MSDKNKTNQNDEQPRRFDQQQYKLLKKCSNKKDITKWNKWREKNKGVDIFLEGAIFPREVCLKGANLVYAKLKDASFEKANLEGADLRLSDLENVNFFGANLKSAKLVSSNMKGIKLSMANLKGAAIWSADLENALLDIAHLENTNFSHAYLKGACFDESYLQDSDFELAIIDGETSIWKCAVNRYTNFSGVGLDSIRIDPATKQLLKYNIRRMNWEDWYKEHKILKWPVWLFWQMSDYGISTLRIIAWFFGLALIFAVIYRLWPGLVIVRGGADHLRDFVHALYFSVVTMTTLGFGDIAGNPDSHWGQILLMIQVILGYVLLGALITRLAVLFTGEGPAGKFADEKKNKSVDNGNDEIS